MKKTVLILVLALTAWGCQTFNSDYLQGTKAEMSQNYEEAVHLYQKATLKNPKEAVYRLALARARAAASL